ncbi:arylesterase [Aliidiomarina sanyensis]|uniref:Arylesterase n=1 Tax=Aliidiomarina sanyensis TaxID=1249555 RepID=A0A432WNJ2_9GAMM|nr:arylesterase [Aliidiomarina sanyensis]RUO35308.1 arylesterase [Aliidiomarina sanyensis]
MLKKFLYVILVALIALSSTVRASESNVSLMVLGDSLAAGYGIAEADTWVADIGRTWRTHHPRLQIINASISGETTQGGLSRLESLLDRHAPDVVFIELGGNDGLRGFNLNTMESNLRQMVEILQSRNVKVAISEIEIPPNLGRRYTQMFRDVFHRVADDMEIPLIPFFMREIALNPDYMQSDGIHPNLSAQPVIADIMEPQLRALLEAL